MEPTAYYLLCSSSITSKVRGLLQVADSLPSELIGENRFLDVLRAVPAPTGVLLETVEMAVEQLLLLNSSQFEDFHNVMIADYFNALSFGFEDQSEESELGEQPLLSELAFERAKHEELSKNAEGVRHSIKFLKERWIAQFEKENALLEKNVAGCRRSIVNLRLKQLKKEFRN